MVMPDNILIDTPMLTTDRVHMGVAGRRSDGTGTGRKVE